MMFIYFIQKRGFLDSDPNYLRNRLERMRQEQGSDKFLRFYRLFLLRLFHEGLSQPEADRAPELAELLGQVPYLNGGLFDVHELERENPEIHIPDEAFERISRACSAAPGAARHGRAERASGAGAQTSEASAEPRSRASPDLGAPLGAVALGASAVTERSAVEDPAGVGGVNPCGTIGHHVGVSSFATNSVPFGGCDRHGVCHGGTEAIDWRGQGFVLRLAVHGLPLLSGTACPPFRSSLPPGRRNSGAERRRAEFDEVAVEVVAPGNDDGGGDARLESPSRGSGGTVRAFMANAVPVATADGAGVCGENTLSAVIDHCAMLAQSANPGGSFTPLRSVTAGTRNDTALRA